MVRNAREENTRRGGWVRIFPTPDTWQNYGGILEYSSQNNLILHEHLYPNATRDGLTKIGEGHVIIEKEPFLGICICGNALPFFSLHGDY